MSAVYAQSNLTVAQDVRRLISQVEQGHAFDFEMTGHAYDVMGAASEAVTNRVHSTTLAQDIEHRVERFAQVKGSAQMYLRLVITDIAPELPEYDPSEVVIFDGVNGGTNFSTADVRLTNAGTVMTSVNITDLKAYFEAGRKRILVAYMGTDRNADAKANDRLLNMLPDMLAAMGMDAGAIKQIIEAVKAGTVPAVVSKLLHQIIEIAQAKAVLQAQPDNKEAQAKLTVLEKDVVSLIAHIQTLPNLPTVFAKAFEPIKPANIAVAVALPTVQTVSASNDNRTALRTVRELIQELRQTAKDRSLPPEQRQEIASILRDLRAGARSVNPSPLRLGDGLLKLNTLTASVMAQPVHPAIYDRILPRAISATQTVSASNDNRTALRTVRELIQELRQTAKDRSLPPEQRQEIASILRDLRAGARSVNPSPLRLGDGLLKLNTLTASVMAQPVHQAIYDRILPRAISATLVLASSPFLSALKPVFASILRDMPVSPQMRSLLSQVSENGKAAQMLARFISRNPESVRSLTTLPLIQAMQPFKAADLISPIKMVAAPSLNHRRQNGVTAFKTIPATGSPAQLSIVASAGLRLSYSNVVSLPGIQRPVPMLRLAPDTMRFLPSSLSAVSNAPAFKVAQPTPTRTEAAVAKNAPAPSVTPAPTIISKPVMATPDKAAPTISEQTVKPVAPPTSPAPDKPATVAPIKTDTKIPDAAPSQPATPVKTATSSAPVSEPVKGIIATPAPAEAPKPGDVKGATPESNANVIVQVAKGQDTAQPNEATPSQAPKVVEGGLQYNADGTLKDCCKAPFQNVAALKEALAAKPDATLEPQSVAPLQPLQFVAADGTVSAVTVQQVNENAAAHESIKVGPMQDLRGNTIPTSETAQKNWTNDTLNLLKTPAPTEDKVNLKFNHVCGDGCTHGQGFKATDPTADTTTGKIVNNRDVDVQFVAVEPKPNSNPTSKRPQRSMKPA